MATEHRKLTEAYQALTKDEKDRLAKYAIASEFVSNPAFRKALSDFVWKLNNAATIKEVEHDGNQSTS